MARQARREPQAPSDSQAQQARREPQAQSDRQAQLAREPQALSDRQSREPMAWPAVARRQVQRAPSAPRGTRVAEQAGTPQRQPGAPVAGPRLERKVAEAVAARRGAA